MALRYSGDLQIRVTYQDRGDYKASVTTLRGPSRRWSGYVSPAPAGFGRGVAYDSPQAYDEIAHAALSFAAYSDEDRRGGDWVTEEAAYDPDGSGWHIGRSRLDAWPQ